MKNLSLTNISEKLLSDEIITYVYEHTMILVRKKINHTFTINQMEMKTYFQFYSFLDIIDYIGH